MASREDVTTAISTVPAGTPVPLTVRRKERTIEVALRAERPPRGLGLEVLERSVGLRVAAAGQGLVIERVAPGSVAAERGLRRGDIVLGANGQRVGSAEELGREVLRALDRGGLLLAVERGRYVYNLDFPL